MSITQIGAGQLGAGRTHPSAEGAAEQTEGQTAEPEQPANTEGEQQPEQPAQGDASPKTFVCNEPGCGKDFATVQGLTMHQLSHRMVTCEGCGREFTVGNIKQHQKFCPEYRALHPEEPPAAATVLQQRNAALRLAQRQEVLAFMSNGGKYTPAMVTEAAPSVASVYVAREILNRLADEKLVRQAGKAPTGSGGRLPYVWEITETGRRLGGETMTPPARTEAPPRTQERQQRLSAAFQSRDEDPGPALDTIMSLLYPQGVRNSAELLESAKIIESCREIILRERGLTAAA